MPCPFLATKAFIFPASLRATSLASTHSPSRFLCALYLWNCPDTIFVKSVTASHFMHPRMTLKISAWHRWNLTCSKPCTTTLQIPYKCMACYVMVVLVNLWLPWRTITTFLIPVADLCIALQEPNARGARTHQTPIKVPSMLKRSVQCSKSGKDKQTDKRGLQREQDGI